MSTIWAVVPIQPTGVKNVIFFGLTPGFELGGEEGEEGQEEGLFEERAAVCVVHGERFFRLIVRGV